MLDSGTTIRLMVGLIGAVYLLLQYMASREQPVRRAMIPVGIAIAAVVGVWVITPGVLSIGDLGLSVTLRRVGLGLGGAAIAARYLSIRRPDREVAAKVAGILAAPLLGVSLTIASGNWLVAIAAALLAATAFVRRAAASGDEDSRQSPRPPDSE